LIVGVENPKDGALMKSLYAPILRDQVKIFEMSRESAELTKYASNAMLATRISFMNEIALLAERVGADVESVRAGIGSDSRIGPEFLSAGIGFGGSCFPKDLKALVKMGEQNSLAMHVIRAALEVNSNQRGVLVAKAIDHFGSLKGMKCAIWGLSFKPETDDLRYAPSIEIVNSLVVAGARVSAYDPAFSDASRFGEFAGGKFELCNTAYEAVADADMLFLVTEWREFMSPDFRRMNELMNQPVIFDGRNIWNPQSLKSRGFTYFSIGRKE
jgi:UDPglucose 6-dehydrogenase